MEPFGVITEQGDLGLGFEPLQEKDNELVNEANNRDKARNQTVINEDKK